MLPSLPLAAGERLSVSYAIRGSEREARERAAKAAVEQSIEFPPELLPEGGIRDQVLGRVEAVTPAGEGRWLARVSYAATAAAGDISQLLNVVFGNTSMQPGIRVEAIDLPDGLLAALPGPRYGIAGWRALLGVPERPLLCTAIKPVGLPASELGKLAYQFALGGIDLIKDDHGLADQPYAPYADRLAACVEGVERANAETGYRCAYLPNVTAGGSRSLQNARAASAAGAGGLLVSPGLAGFGSLQEIAADDAVSLPVMSHPALQGSFTAHPEGGISHRVLYGLIARLAGADASIFPNYGGRFSFTREECQAIADACREPLGQLRPAFPTPGGGMTLERVPELLDAFGRDVILLVGGGLHAAGDDLVQNCRAFRRMVEA